MRTHAVCFILLLLSFTGYSTAAAAERTYDNDRSLNGVERASVYFDVNLKDDGLLVFRMDLLDKTIKSMEEAGLDVRAVIGFRGHASRFITRDDHYVLEEQIENKKKIQNWISYFSSRDIVIEQCAIAAQMHDISTEDFLPEVTIVGNGYISLVGYQAQGYSVVPMD